MMTGAGVTVGSSDAGTARREMDVQHPAGTSMIAPEETDRADEEWEDPDILGYAGVLMVPDEFDITKISVRGDQRRQGIGRALLEELQRRLPAFGVRKIFLEVRKSNTAAVRLYESCGFSAVGERKKYYAEPVEDAIVMRWESGDAPE